MDNSHHRNKSVLENKSINNIQIHPRVSAAQFYSIQNTPRKNNFLDSRKPQSEISKLKEEILFLENENSKINKKPKLSKLIDEFLSKFYKTFKKNFNNEIKEIMKVLKEKYESEKEMTMEYLDQNLEIDMIFNKDEGIDILIYFIIYFEKRK